MIQLFHKKGAICPTVPISMNQLLKLNLGEGGNSRQHFELCCSQQKKVAFDRFQWRSSEVRWDNLQPTKLAIYINSNTSMLENQKRFSSTLFFKNTFWLSLGKKCIVVVKKPQNYQKFIALYGGLLEGSKYSKASRLCFLIWHGDDSDSEDWERKTGRGSGLGNSGQYHLHLIFTLYWPTIMWMKTA